jgi:hypothetical protein
LIPIQNKAHAASKDGVITLKLKL